MSETEKPQYAVPQKFTVALRRNQISEVSIEVEATSEKEAVNKATEMAKFDDVDWYAHIDSLEVTYVQLQKHTATLLIPDWRENSEPPK